MGFLQETSPLVPTPNPSDPTTIDIHVSGCQKGDSGIGFSERWARSQDYSHDLITTLRSGLTLLKRIGRAIWNARSAMMIVTRAPIFVVRERVYLELRF